MPRRNDPKHKPPGRNKSARSKMRQTLDDYEMPTSNKTRWQAHRPRADSQPKTPVAIICPSGKIGLTKQVAQTKLDLYSTQTNRRENKPVRIYECPKCASWHLTSRPKR